MLRHVNALAKTISASAIVAIASTALAQTIEVTNDQGVVVSGIQRVNVGEHVRLRIRGPSGLVPGNLIWTIPGTHLKDWITKDGRPVEMLQADYNKPEVEFLWKDTTPAAMPNVVRVTGSIGSSPVFAEMSFEVIRHEKAEKYYSDDRLMENHNNWHSVYMFAYASTRRGDLFLAWHRSQLEYFDKWRSYFGYPAAPLWNPATAWVVGSPAPISKQHPSSSAPKKAFSARHDLITLDLTDQNLATEQAGEYDFVTQAQGNGTTPAFMKAGYVLHTDTIRALTCDTDCPAELGRKGVIDLPAWWRATPSGPTPQADPWFAAGCPAPPTPLDQASKRTCTPSRKSSLSDYSLRELGESIESGLYAADFQINYHALGHIAASIDMSNPVTSMRDPIFWGWHKHIDGILSSWQNVRGGSAGEPLVVSAKPEFGPAWSTIRLEFSQAVTPEFVLASSLTVQGFQAKVVKDVSKAPRENQVFEFSGFPVPQGGNVEVALRRELNNDFRTAPTDPRPVPTLIMSRFGNALTPSVNQWSYTKP